jgi:hypothetical protein
MECMMKSREEYWAGWPNQNWVYDSDYSKAITLAPTDLSPINHCVFDIIYHSLNKEAQQSVGSPKNAQDILNYLDEQSSFSINFEKNADRFVHLEQLIVNYLNEKGLLKQIKGIQFPIDVRVVQATPPPGYLDRKDAIDYIHCDGWRGEPNDGVNCLLYCWANEDCSRLHILDLPEQRMDDMVNFQGDERNTGNLLQGLRPIEFEHKSGVLVLFDSYAPHCAERHGSRTRISLNFSLRREDVYRVFDDRWARKRQSWDKFWRLPQSGVSTFKERCASELSQLEQEAAQLRQAYIDNKLLNNYTEDY